MSRHSVPCDHCGCQVMPTKRGMDLNVALFNHIRLSHPDVKVNLVVPLTDLRPTTQEQST